MHSELQQYIEVNRFRLWPFYSQERVPVTHCVWGWVGSQRRSVGLRHDEEKNLCPWPKLNYDPPSPQPITSPSDRTIPKCVNVSYSSRHQTSRFKATEGLHPPHPPYRAALSQQYSVASFATVRVLSCLHSPGLLCLCCNVVRFSCDLQACNLMTSSTVCVTKMGVSKSNFKDKFPWFYCITHRSCGYLTTLYQLKMLYNEWKDDYEWFEDGCLLDCRSPGSSSSIVSDYGLDDRDSIPDRGIKFFF
jgi:hypothetical protein